MKVPEKETADESEKVEVEEEVIELVRENTPEVKQLSEGIFIQSKDQVCSGFDIIPEKQVISVEDFVSQRLDIFRERHNNPQVLEIIKNLKPFDWHATKVEESEERVYKSIQLLPDGYKYEGDWIGDVKDGRGVQIWSDGSRFEGYWKKNCINGHGRLVSPDGEVYEGEWLNNQAEGFGVSTHSDGTRYEGGWLNDQQHGKGIETWPDGSKYEGDYERAEKHGKGKFTWPDESCYEGEYFHNQIYGFGTYTWVDGRVFKGEWVENKMEGVGCFRWPDGRFYIGDYKNDLKHGKGAFHWPDGRKYTGGWHLGQMHGQGTYEKNGEKRNGLWEYGVRLRWVQDGAISLESQKSFKKMSMRSSTKQSNLASKQTYRSNNPQEPVFELKEKVKLQKSMDEKYSEQANDVDLHEEENQVRKVVDKIWLAYDTNATGVLTKDQARKFFEELLGDQKGDEAKFNNIFRKLDTEDTGSLSKKQMIVFMFKLVRSAN